MDQTYYSSTPPLIPGSGEFSAFSITNNLNVAQTSLLNNTKSRVLIKRTTPITLYTENDSPISTEDILNGLFGVNSGVSINIVLPTATNFINDLKRLGIEPNIGDTFQFTVFTTQQVTASIQDNTGINMIFDGFNYIYFGFSGGGGSGAFYNLSMTFLLRINDVINPSCTLYAMNFLYPD